MCVLYRVDYGNMKNKTFGPELFHFFRDRIEKPNIDIIIGLVIQTNNKKNNKSPKLCLGDLIKSYMMYRSRV
jgi:5,10-methylenetetrahydrofolate reductase